MNEPRDTQIEPPRTATLDQQRDLLEESEERASEDQPKSFDERNLTDKVVEIPPKETTEQPIKGLDPQQRDAEPDGKGGK